MKGISLRWLLEITRIFLVMYLNKMSFEKRYKLPSGKKNGVLRKAMRANPFFTRQCLFKRNMFLFSCFSNIYCISVIVLFLVWLFICLYCFCVRVLVFGGALAFTDLYQDKHTPKCHFSKLNNYHLYFWL